MGYSDIRGRKQHEADEERIAELEAQLKRESQSKSVTIEKTSKKLKGRLVISWVVIIAGVLTSYVNTPASAIIVVVGIFALVYTKTQIWWRHG